MGVASSKSSNWTEGDKGQMLEVKVVVVEAAMFLVAGLVQLSTLPEAASVHLMRENYT